ncbi:MAG: hypothetical protein AAB500_00920 [Patescibacteria group bacterium]
MDYNENEMLQERNYRLDEDSGENEMIEPSADEKEIEAGLGEEDPEDSYH